jgi:hypothetical protein
MPIQRNGALRKLPAAASSGGSSTERTSRIMAMNAPRIARFVWNCLPHRSHGQVGASTGPAPVPVRNGHLASGKSRSSMLAIASTGVAHVTGGRARTTVRKRFVVVPRSLQRGSFAAPPPRQICFDLAQRRSALTIGQAACARFGQSGRFATASTRHPVNDRGGRRTGGDRCRRGHTGRCEWWHRRGAAPRAGGHGGLARRWRGPQPR